MQQNDNRAYQYTNNFTEDRPEYNSVCSLIDMGVSVIDMGCGEGSLMQKLIIERKCKCTGIEISESGVAVCLQKNLNVVKGEIDKIVPFATNEFDVALCNVTLQMVNYPEKTIQEMKRVASKKIIISFPNFAYWLNRLEMLFKGRMPKKLLFGYSWYSTGHIHQFSLLDIKQLIKEVGALRVKKIACVKSGNVIIDMFAKWLPNIFGKIIILEIEKINEL